MYIYISIVVPCFLLNATFLEVTVTIKHKKKCTILDFLVFLSLLHFAGKKNTTNKKAQLWRFRCQNPIFVGKTPAGNGIELVLQVERYLNTRRSWCSIWYPEWIGWPKYKDSSKTTVGNEVQVILWKNPTMQQLIMTIMKTNWPLFVLHPKVVTCPTIKGLPWISLLNITKKTHGILTILKVDKGDCLKLEKNHWTVANYHFHEVQISLPSHHFFHREIICKEQNGHVYWEAVSTLKKYILNNWIHPRLTKYLTFSTLPSSQPLQPDSQNRAWH